MYKVLGVSKNIYYALRQDFTTQPPGEVWVAYITFIWTRQGWLYLASLMNLYSRKITGFSMGDRLIIKRAMAHQAPKEGLIHHWIVEEPLWFS